MMKPKLSTLGIKDQMRVKVATWVLENECSECYPTRTAAISGASLKFHISTPTVSRFLKWYNENYG